MGRFARGRGDNCASSILRGMPTPVGHALAGVAAGCLLAGRVDRTTLSTLGTALSWRSLALTLDKRLLLFASLGVLADIDFLFGVHSAYTHSVGATLVVGGVAALLGRGRSRRFALAATMAYGTHIVLDWLGSDTVEPLGVMALWPFTTDYFLSNLYWFPSVCRQFRDLSCWSHNVASIAWEIVFLGPLAFGALYLNRRSRRT